MKKYYTDSDKEHIRREVEKLRNIDFLLGDTRSIIMTLVEVLLHMVDEHGLFKEEAEK